jgi:hypothetical protein
MKTAPSDGTQLLERVRKSLRRAQKRASLASQGAALARRLADAFSAAADREQGWSNESQRSAHHQPDIN